MGFRRSRMPLLVVWAVLLLVSVTAPAAAAHGVSKGDRPAGPFIVTLRDGTSARTVAGEYRRQGGADITQVYSAALNGFAGSLSHAALGGLLRDRRVARVERDGLVTASATQIDATWGLDRLDTRDLVLDGTFEYFSTGAGVHAYVIDTGIRLTHEEFAGRIGAGYDAVTSGGTANDCHGHGTHVAGTVGGTTYGVAKAVTLHPVRVLDCNGSGTMSDVIAGVDWVTKNHVKPAVVNMSLGGGGNSSLDDAVRHSIAQGVVYTVAAGNDGKDACNYSPARVDEALTAAATDSKDTKPSWSNFGSCVDLFAPGVSVTSAWHSTDTSTKTMSGASMAAPHVAGVAAQYLALHPTSSPADVFAEILANSTAGKVKSAGSGSPDRLLHSRYGEEPSESTNAAPSAMFTSSCDGLTCAFTDSSTDSDGSVIAWSWAFGDGNGSSSQHPSHTFPADGAYTVTLTVTDDNGATATASTSVSVTAPSTDGITLQASGYKIKGWQHADLSWAGTGSTSVDVYRDGNKAATTPNDGAHTDKIGKKGGGSYRYRVCEAGTATCSNDVTVSF